MRALRALARLVPKMRVLPIVAIVALALAFAAPAAAEAEFAPGDLEFFESKIRPLLVDRCQKCHGPKKQEGNLRLDSRPALLAGGDTGPAVVPGRPAESLLVDAINYGDTYQMPPKSKLPAAEIALLTDWVARGAPWPVEQAAAGSAASKFDLPARRAAHWAWQPIRPVLPPAVRAADWPRQRLDQFILAPLETAGLAPAPPADRRTLIRRLYFDLVGLPPDPAAVRAYLDDPAPDATERLVDRLLASPHFGERWGRHWLDLVRYAETHGHEFDRSIFHAWRYRDYVIRAWNADLPYDQFLREHLAGDLLPQPRLAADGSNESLLATGFFWLGEQTHSPVDVQQHLADRIDNQIDVLGKALLGLTVACARCHDHKFDAISTEDYYALYGVVAGSRYAQRSIDPPSRLAQPAAELDRLRLQLQAPLAQAWSVQAQSLAACLLAAREAAAGRPAEAAAAAHGAPPALVARWVAALAGPAVAAPAHPFFPWSRAAAAPHLPDAWNQLAAELRPPPPAPAPDYLVLLDFSRHGFENCQVDGLAFGSAPTLPGELGLGAGPVLLPSGWAHSGRLAPRLQGALRTASFMLDRRYLHVLARGRGARFNLVVDGFSLICDPIYGTLKRRLDDDQPRWHTIDLQMWAGQRAYLELLDCSVPDPTEASPYPDDGYLAVAQAVLSDGPPPALAQPPAAPALLSLDPPASLPALAHRYQQAVLGALAAWGQGPLERSPRGQAQAELLAWLLDQQLLTLDPADPSAAACTALASQLRQRAADLPVPTYAAATAEGSAIDERLFIRGSYKVRGDVVPRRFLTAISGPQQPPWGAGSGRLELVEHLLDPANPFPARVLVNRLWHHLFGRGLVPSVDNFGALGEAPTHPELLDDLAARLVRGGWRLKPLVRELVLSQTYQMSSRPLPAARAADPQNRLWHSMPVRRLQGEVIRDALLAVSGRLDPALAGPPVPVHLTPFMDGRGRPGDSGPLDGGGRRSVYQEIRRNFLSPWMLAFDTPLPLGTVGRRSVSNVPAQALILLNDPLVAQLARRCAQRLLAPPGQSAQQRFEALYQAALGRPPHPDETDRALAFLAGQARLYGTRDDDPRVWADLCQVVFNLKEFVFLE